MEVIQAAACIHCSFFAVSAPDVLNGLPGNPKSDPKYEKALFYGVPHFARSKKFFSSCNPTFWLFSG
jgi:hypothetical protein